MRYVAIPARSWVSYQHTPETLPTCVAHEADPAPVNTGLLNADGVPLYRVPERGPLGFCRTEVKS
jgi:hypothetical protein